MSFINKFELSLLTVQKRYPKIKIGFSKFCTLWPKWRVLASSSGSHSVCVFVIHQNVFLMVDAMNNDRTYKDSMAMIVCDLENKTCMLHGCSNCPGTEKLRSFFISNLDEGEVSFQQWQSTDSSQMVTVSMILDEFIQLMIESIDSLTAHSYIARCQGRYLKERKRNIDDETALVLGDFAENYTFSIQDEIQSYHWNKQYCTLHPVVLYYKEKGQLVEKSFCFFV